MPRFYINFRNGNLGTQEEILATDDVGIEVPGFEEARAAAMVSAREVLADNIKSNSPHPMESIFITDEAGQEVMTIPANNVVPETAK